jgi:hypothetical protein
MLATMSALVFESSSVQVVKRDGEALSVIALT